MGMKSRKKPTPESNVTTPRPDPIIRRMFEVESSTISSMGYDCKAEVLQIEFKNGARYQYANFLPIHWAELCNAESVGKAFQIVKNNEEAFPFTKVEVSPPKPDAS